ncbi:MAG: PhoH family protein [candidate division WOR-3 bacterium]
MTPGETKRLTLEIGDLDPLSVFGLQDANLKALRRHFPDVAVSARDREIILEGPAERAEEALSVLRKIMALSAAGERPDDLDVDEAVAEVHAVSGGLEIITPKRKVFPRSPNQEHYIREIAEHDIVFAIGPAGTGKTYLAVAMAIRFLLEGRVERLIFTRPAVEAGESLGFLPGTYTEKIFPYLVPLYDALYALMPPQRVQRLEEKRILEIAPLAYMRGRTLSDAFIILDEAQNTRPVQMKMFLTRLGPRSRVVVTGDITQIDLPKGVPSGLVEAERILRGIRGISFVYFSSEDVVRHRLVKDIVEAYESRELKEE